MSPRQGPSCPVGFTEGFLPTPHCILDHQVLPEHLWPNLHQQDRRSKAINSATVQDDSRWDPEPCQHGSSWQEKNTWEGVCRGQIKFEHLSCSKYFDVCSICGEAQAPCAMYSWERAWHQVVNGKPHGPSILQSLARIGFNSLNWENGVGHCSRLERVSKKGVDLASITLLHCSL